MFSLFKFLQSAQVQLLYQIVNIFICLFKIEKLHHYLILLRVRSRRKNDKYIGEFSPPKIAPGVRGHQINGLRMG